MNILFKMHMFMLSWDATLGLMQFLKHLKFLEYLFGIEHEGGRDADGKRSILIVYKINV